MPAWNADAYLEQAVVSVLAQTHDEWQLFVIDDSSTDETGDIIDRLAASDPRITRLRTSVRSGAAAARNLGIQAAQGRYIAFLDADDVWAPHKLSSHLAFMKNRDAALSFTGYWRGGQGGLWRYVPAPSRVDRTRLMRANVIGCLTVMYDQTALGKVEMPVLHQRQDYGLWLELLNRMPYAYGLDEGLAGYRRGTQNPLSGNVVSAQRANWRFFRRHLQQGRFRSARNMFTNLLQKAVWLLRTKAQHNPQPWLP